MTKNKTSAAVLIAWFAAAAPAAAEHQESLGDEDSRIESQKLIEEHWNRLLAAADKKLQAAGKFLKDAKPCGAEKPAGPRQNFESKAPLNEVKACTVPGSGGKPLTYVPSLDRKTGKVTMALAKDDEAAGDAAAKFLDQRLAYAKERLTAHRLKRLALGEKKSESMPPVRGKPAELCRAPAKKKLPAMTALSSQDSRLKDAYAKRPSTRLPKPPGSTSRPKDVSGPLGFLARLFSVAASRCPYLKQQQRSSRAAVCDDRGCYDQYGRSLLITCDDRGCRDQYGNPR